MSFCFTQMLFMYINPGMLPIIQFEDLIGQRLWYGWHLTWFIDKLNNSQHTNLNLLKWP